MRAIFTVLVVGLVAAFLVPGLGSAASAPKLVVVVEGNGRVTSSDQRIDCPGTCEAEYPNHGTVDLNAVPASTADSFNGWSEDCQGTSKCSLTMDQDRKVKASFTGAPASPTPTATAEPSSSPSPTPTAQPSSTATVAPTASAQPSPTATPEASQSPGAIAAHLIRRARSIRNVAPRPEVLKITAERRFTCRRECVLAAVLRDRAGKRRTLARGSASVRAGRSPGVKLRFTRYGRTRLVSGRRRARLTVTVQNGGPVARRSRDVLLRVKG